MKYSIILPCRDEELAIESCIHSIQKIMRDSHFEDYEILVSDSSTDQSPIIADRLGARVIKHDKRGYGAACLEGIRASKGSFIFFADADGTYDFGEIPRFFSFLDKGYDLVIGSRFRGKMDKRSMPTLHRYIGNPFFSFLMRTLFRSSLTDTHCGMRALTREAFEQLSLKASGMEFASEMIIRSLQENLRIKEVPIHYSKRLGSSKLRPLRDGYRHVRLMFLFNPIASKTSKKNSQSSRMDRRIQ